jgi:diguanylate cyclase (GGDEF)-like protein
MLLDLRTLLVAVALASFCCAVARLLLMRLHPAMPGPGYWALGGALGALGLGLIAATGLLPQFFTLPLPLLVTVAGFICGWNGFLRFIGKPIIPAWLMAGFMAAALSLIFAYVNRSLSVYALFSGCFVSLVSALISHDLFAACTPNRLAMRATAYLSAINAGAFALRVVSVMLGAPQVNPLQPSPISSIALLWWLAITIALTLGMILMAGERLQEDLDHQANSDPLTGALNRRAFTLLAQKEESRARRTGQPLSVLMMDLDHFKQINDRLGHAAGDALLCRFVGVAERVLRGEDIFCRFGGEEFLALLPNSTDEQSLAIAERLRDAFAVEANASLDPSLALPFTPSVSIGISQLRPGEALEAAQRRADNALYRAKAGGRNRSELSDAAAAA